MISIAVGCFILGNLNLQISPVSIGFPNFLFGVGLGLSMIPIITLLVATLRNDQMTNATGLQNLLKNIGGAFGTSIVATLITRGTQKHQFMLIQHLTDLTTNYVERVQAYTSAFITYVDSSTANYMAKGLINKLLIQQATLCAFIDAFRVFALASLIIIPPIFLIKKLKK